MSAGILTLDSNSDVVTGLDTKFTTELTAGDFIVVTTGGVTYTLPVKTIMSDTDLTLARNYNGPSASGLAWTAVPRDTLNRISAQIAADTAYIIRQRVLEVDNWYQLLEVNGIITIKMADGSSYTGPSWLKLIDVMNTLGIDELLPLAEQIHTDAQQVANDKPIIIKAKDDALAAAVHAAASEGNAATSEGKAGASATTAAQRAADAAESAKQAAASNPLLALQKALNLQDLTDKNEACNNLDVYQKSEVYSKQEVDEFNNENTQEIKENTEAITVTNKRVGYALLDFGTMSLSQRKVMANPFGNSQPVEVIAETLRTDLTGAPVWSQTGWLFITGPAASFGVAANYVEGQGIVVQCGMTSLGHDNTYTGSGHQFNTGAVANNLPVRVHVRKVTA
ncbi:hypothetical protein [Kluyvera georgiana]|uniref:hypothetical protein n=1 Tax=Kluyvera georgiana TaxID=73098 RepID=UPI003F67B500